eukprot:TRINITY_DN27534_c0_g1_i1.p1 TRINITY_DN27534_c0_g1~~TRINITY_DN27534_c0_g1_i1.p1  ORF type:complete len:390 (-),score=50.35 TRINITY_DN27534_c0_g1_i1:54-1223(-)
MAAEESPRATAMETLRVKVANQLSSEETQDPWEVSGRADRLTLLIMQERNNRKQSIESLETQLQAVRDMISSSAKHCCDLMEEQTEALWKEMRKLSSKVQVALESQKKEKDRQPNARLRSVSPTMDFGPGPVDGNKEIMASHSQQSFSSARGRMELGAGQWQPLPAVPPLQLNLLNQCPGVGAAAAKAVDSTSPPLSARTSPRVPLMCKGGGSLVASATSSNGAMTVPVPSPSSDTLPISVAPTTGTQAQANTKQCCATAIPAQQRRAWSVTAPSAPGTARHASPRVPFVPPPARGHCPATPVAAVSGGSSLPCACTVVAPRMLRTQSTVVSRGSVGRSATSGAAYSNGVVTPRQFAGTAPGNMNAPLHSIQRMQHAVLRAESSGTVSF